MNSAAAALAAELRMLHGAAGAPKLATLVRQGRMQNPPIKLNDATISDWLGGNTVPSKPEALRFLVITLEATAVQRGKYRARGAQWWLGLRRQAWEQTHQNRGGRPRKTTTGRAPRPGRSATVSDRLPAVEAAAAQAKQFVESDIDHPVIPLRCSSAQGERPAAPTDLTLSDSVRAAVDDNVALIFVLGEVGAGKTWFLKQFMASILKEYLAGRSTYLPQYLDLGQCLSPAGSAVWPWDWERLIESDRLANDRLLLLDAFDEAVAKSPPGSRLRLLESIMSVAAQNHAIVTSRSNLFETKERLTRLIDAARLSRPGRHGDRRDLRLTVLFVRRLSDGDVKSFLQEQFDDHGGQMWQQMKSIVDLTDLAKRPVLLPMVCDSLALLKGSWRAQSITSGRLYRLYTDRWLARESWRLHMSEETGRHFLEDLALHLHNEAIDTVPFDEISHRLPDYFPADRWSPDRDTIGEALRSASFLTNDAAGEHGFAHRSFLEYFLGERLMRAFRRSEFSLELARFPSKVTDSFVLDFLQEEPHWMPRLLPFARRGETPILRYLAVYLISRIADFVDRPAVIAELSAALESDTSPFVVRELLVTLIRLGAEVDSTRLDEHLENPIPDPIIQAELTDYYGSLEEARQYLREQLVPGSSSPIRLFYLISLTSICGAEDANLLRYYAGNGRLHEVAVAEAALARISEINANAD